MRDPPATTPARQRGRAATSAYARPGPSQDGSLLARKTSAAAAAPTTASASPCSTAVLPACPAVVRPRNRGADRTSSSAARERTGWPWPGAASALNRSWAEAWPGEECRWHREGRACRTQPPFAPRRRPRQGRAPKTLLRLDDVGCARSPVAGRRAHRARVARDLRSPGAVGGHGRGCRLSARRGLVDLVAVAAGFGHDRSGHDRRVQVVVEP